MGGLSVQCLPENARCRRATEPPGRYDDSSMIELSDRLASSTQSMRNGSVYREAAARMEAMPGPAALALLH